MSTSNHTPSGFQGISPSEFFYRNRQMAGFGNPVQSVYSTVRELVENSLDACEDACISPRVRVELKSASPEVLTIAVSDNGPGVPYQAVPAAFGKVLFGSKYDRRQRRGTFGLGVTMAILHGQITTDTPVLIRTKMSDQPGREFILLVDVKENEPIIEAENAINLTHPGTSVTIRLRGDLKRAAERVVDYLQLTTIASPHAVIDYVIENVKGSTGGWVKELPTPPSESKPHPRAADFELLRRLASKDESRSLHDFLVESFQQVGAKTSRKLLSFLALNPSLQVGSISRNDLSRLSTALRNFDGFAKPDSKCLSPIGKTSFLRAVRLSYDSAAASYASRGPSEWEGNPFIIEGVLAVGNTFSSSEIPTLFRFANRVPLLYDASEDVLTKTVKRVSWSRYGLRSPEPVALFLHLCSSRIPYKAAGKQSITTMATIETEAFSLLRELGRNLSKLAGKKERSVREAKKRREFSEMFGMVAKFSSELAGNDEVPPIHPLVEQLFEVNPDV
ncbi:MAG: DNA topoisomerase VI subunit B [Candidatus Hodarchaeota archaeon]